MTSFAIRSAALGLMTLPCFAATPIKVFLLAGQSNMSGWTKSTGMPAMYTASQANVLIYADGEIDASKKKKWLSNGLDFGQTAGWFGPELVFGKTLSDSLPGTKIALIKYAVGSTYLATHWRPPSSGGTVGSHYNAMHATVTSGLAALDPQYTPEWAGMLWMQGEFDGGNQGYAREYETNLANFVKDVRGKLKVPELPFIIGMIDSSNSWPFAGTIRAAERNVAKNTANIGLVDTKDFATDNIHYKLDGMIALGKGFALNYLANFRTPTGLARPGADRSATPLLSAKAMGIRSQVCRGADCFAADGRWLAGQAKP